MRPYYARCLWGAFLVLLVSISAVLQSPTKASFLRLRARAPAVTVSQPAPIALLALPVLVLAASAVIFCIAIVSRCQRVPPSRASRYGTFADDWGVTLGDIVQAEASVLEVFGTTALAGPLATFLLAKGVTEEDARYGLNRAVEKLQRAAPPGTVVRPDVSPYYVMPYLRWFLNSSHSIACAMRERSDRLLSVGDTPLPHHNGGAAALEIFIAAHPEWNDDTAYVSLRHSKLKYAVISRVQRSGVCFLHAVIVGLHYLLNFHSTTPHASVVDITCFLRRNLTDGSLSRYLFADDGGFLEEIIQKYFTPAAGDASLDILHSGSADSNFTAMRSQLELHAIGFVHSFDIEPAFESPMVTSHFVRSFPSPQYMERHAMLLVGVRFDAHRGEYVMLLQNWWAKEFVEVGQSYWKKSNAKLLFVESPQTTMPIELRTVKFVHAAAGVVGAGVLEPRQTG